MTKLKKMLFVLTCLASIKANAEILLEDDVEHGQCHGLNTPSKKGLPTPLFISTCKNNSSGSIIATDERAHSGHYSYKLPVTITDTTPEEVTQGRGIHIAKMAANSARLNEAQKLGSTIRYTAHFYIESGFYDSSWHIQMQWKGYSVNKDGKRRYWERQNPKLSWGFRKLASETHAPSVEPPLQVVATIREAYPNNCSKFSYDLFTRRSTLNLPPIPVEKSVWIKITTEIYFHRSNGYLRIWQGDDNQGELIIDAQNINTASQMIASDIADKDDPPCLNTHGNGEQAFKYSSPTHFSFGLANYLSGHSFSKKYNGNPTPHVLYIDDISIKLIKSDQADIPPSAPILSAPPPS